MSTTKPAKSCLVISYGPVPTSQYQTVEGGGMRAWGLAKGLAAQGREVTVAVNGSFPQDISEFEDIKLTTWSLDHRFVDLLNSYDMVITSYCMGDASVFIAKNISPEITLVLDAYVPIYVEVSARDSKDIKTEYTNYMDDIERFNFVLKRGDYFLCANETQKIYYTGVLSSLGIVNPRSYRENRILVVPFGIHDVPAVATYNPYEKLGLKNDDFVVLWFGGLYPWFRVEELLEAILKLSSIKQLKFVVVGGKNPFNGNPDFMKQYEKAVAFGKKHKLTNKTLHFVDWVDFNDRINWYQHADLVISINKPGDENVFSWRTRVMDYIWGELAILTNGGDPLSEELLSKHAAIRLDNLSAAEISSKITELQKTPSKLQEAKKQIAKIKSSYVWPLAVLPITRIDTNARPYSSERKFVATLPPKNQQSSAQSHVKKVARKTRNTALFLPRVVRYGHNRGWDRLIYLANRRLIKRPSNDVPKYVFISHPIDDTGAPQVMLQVVEEFAKEYGPARVSVVAPYIAPHLLRKLREQGIKVMNANALSTDAEIAFQLDLRPNDCVFMNTVAIHENYRLHILDELKKGTLKHAFWYIHEDEAQLNVVNKGLNHKLDFELMSKLIEKKRLSVLVPSERVRREYNKILKTDKVRTVLYNIGVDKKYHLKRKADDFKSINFLLQGTPGDSRKGHFVTLIAFEQFLEKYYKKNPDQYRDFKLTFVSIGDDYASQQIRTLGQSLLGNHLEIMGSMPKQKVLEVYRKCNAVICTSLSETFALYVAESMFMGSFVLRNNSAGADEQLINGKNGYALNEKDVDQVTKVIEKVLNKKTTSNESLRKMGVASQELITPYSGHQYLTQILGRSEGISTW